MPSTLLPAAAAPEALAHLGDAALVALAQAGDEPAIRTLVRRHNQRLFRVARAIVRDDGEAEDVVQASYVKAFTHLDGFRGEAQLATWLTRIAVNEAGERLRRRRPTTGLDAVEAEQGRSAQIIQFPTLATPADPETEMSRQEVREVLERAIDTLPDGFRVVFVLRDVEGLGTDETAQHLGLKPDTVKTRLHRARRLMRSAIAAEMDAAFAQLFPFDGARCVNMAGCVLAELRAGGRPGA
jgi:RNA polymerase sigma-70 factor (ECF subfamily)